MPLSDALRAREAQFSARIGRLLGLDPERVGIVNATVEEPAGAAPTLRVDLIMRITGEEAARLRYGDDVQVERTERGTLIINIPDTPETPRA